MKLPESFKINPLKLHTRTTLAVSAVLIAVFAVVAYISNLAINRLSSQGEQQNAQLIATRIASTIEHHIQRQRRNREKSKTETEERIIPNWSEIEETIGETIVATHPELSQVRVLYNVPPAEWREEVRIPQTLDPLPSADETAVKQKLELPKVLSIRDQDNLRSITAVAPIIFTFENRPASQIGTVFVLLSLDRRQSAATTLRSLIWPLLLLAVVAITLITYFLFRHIIYDPIEELLAAMAKAERGNLKVSVGQPSTDEFGRLAAGFTSMLGHIRQMTEQLTREQGQLERRVGEATTALAERNEQLEDANLRLFEMQRQLTQFERLAAAGQLAAQFAHEVGTPLNLISGHVQLLRARMTDEKTAQRLDIISEQIERITKIVRSMLDSTRRPKPRLARLDVNALLEQILDATQPTLMSRDVELRAEMGDGELWIEADPEQLQQVFINLINNSLDAMPAGGTLAVQTSVQNGAGQDRVVIELSDTGEGIPREKLGIIFDPLFSTKDGRGTGLGLTIVKQIITEHGGAIEVESEPPRRTLFRIRLPRTQGGGPQEVKSQEVGSQGG